MSRTDSTSWKVRRLLAMSPTEIVLRAAHRLLQRRGRARGPVAQRELVAPESVLGRRVAAGEAGAFVDGELESGRGRLLRGARDRASLARGLERLGVEPGETVRAAEAVLAGTLNAFGRTTVEVGPDPDWHADPVTGGRWPLVHWTVLDFRSERRLGDPRYVWEVNRHHHLVTLARAYALTGEARFAERVWRDMLSWVGSNPPLFGINWTSPLEVAIRLMSWTMAVDIVGHDGARDGDSAVLAASVSLQARHLSDNLSVYASSRNNHLIGEAVGLMAVGAKFPFLRGSSRWARRGKAILERELIAQVSADGVTREQAFQYETFVLEFALLGAAAAAALGTSLAPESVATIGRMSHFLGVVAGDSGAVPDVGDGDGGRAYELSSRAGRQAVGAAAAAALVTGGEVPGAAVGEDLEAAVWLFGADEALRAAPGPSGGGRREDGTASSFFPDGGYFVPAAGGHRGVIDCGPLGYLSIAAHGHADCLSLVTAHGGRWVLVDPGTCCYHRDRVWRDHFRGTAAHNTVTVDGLSQSEMLGPFMWGRRAKAEQLAWVSNAWFDYFEGAHDGYVRRAGVRHRRSVLFGKRGYWLVVDRLEGRGRHRVGATFQLAEGFVARGAPGGRRTGRLALEGPGPSTVEFAFWLPDGMGVELVEGRESPPAGWVSPAFGERRPAPAVMAEGVLELPVTLLFAIVCGGGEVQVRVDRAADVQAGGAAFEIAFPEGRDVVFAGDLEARGAGRGTWEFSGTVGFIAERAGRTVALGNGVRRWTRDGEDVAYERAADLLSD